MNQANAWVEAEATASAITAQTASECRIESNLLIDGFSLFTVAFEAMTLSPSGPAIAVKAALLSQSLNTFFIIFRSAAAGYYIQALIPLRHVYECWISFWYLTKHPEKAHLWLNGPRPPKVGKMLSAIDHPTSLTKSKLGPFYGELSSFAHVDPAAVVSRLSHECDKTLVGVGVRFDAEDYRACVYGHALWLGMSLDASSIMIPVEHPWHTEYSAIEVRLLEYVEQYNAGHSGPPIPPSDDSAAG